MNKKIFSFFVAGSLGLATMFSGCSKEDPIEEDEPVKDGTFTVKDVTFNMVKVTAGSFTMGATADDPPGYIWEKPTHQVTLTDDYYIGETEVTQALWQVVMGYTPTEAGLQWSETYGLSANKPAYYVSWDDVIEFLAKLNELTGKTFRLPTEAEWEYAARGGNMSKGTIYSGSSNVDDVAWYSVNSYDVGSESADYGNHTVKTKQPNELGLYDMSGNVWEWCSDWYAVYTADAQTNPAGPLESIARVLRSGGWNGGAADVRLALRFPTPPSHRYFNIGFRLALSADK